MADGRDESSQPFQFSIRALLLLTAVVAGACGFASWGGVLPEFLAMTLGAGFCFVYFMVLGIIWRSMPQRVQRRLGHNLGFALLIFILSPFWMIAILAILGSH